MTALTDYVPIHYRELTLLIGGLLVIVMGILIVLILHDKRFDAMPQQPAPATPLTLDAILECYLLGSLASQPTELLHEAQQKVALYHDWGLQHPDVYSLAVPRPEQLRPVFDLIELTLHNRQFGLDGMTALTHHRA